MSIKAERGAKRVCQSCGSKFYDLNRDPIVCPACQSVYQMSGPAARTATGGNNLDADDDAVLDEVAAGEGEELPDIEGDEIGDVPEDEDGALDPGGEEEPFLEAEDEGEADMSGFVGGGKDDEA